MWVRRSGLAYPALPWAVILVVSVIYRFEKSEGLADSQTSRAVSFFENAHADIDAADHQACSRSVSAGRLRVACAAVSTVPTAPLTPRTPTLNKRRQLPRASVARAARRPPAAPQPTMIVT